MSEHRLNESLQERNDRDYAEMTERLRSAIAKIEADSKRKPTQQALCKLASCSRGTLYNRGWPLKELERISEARKAKSSKKNSSPSEQSAETYQQKLYLSREEVLKWKDRYDDVCRQLSQCQELIEGLQARIRILEDELSASRRQRYSAKVVRFSTKAVEP